MRYVRSALTALLALGLIATLVHAATLTHGPLILYATPDSVLVWLRTSAPATVTVERADGSMTAPVVLSACADFTGSFPLTGLAPDTAITYRTVVDGVPGSWTTARTAPAPDAAVPVKVAFFADAGSQNNPAPALTAAAALFPALAVELGDMPHSNAISVAAMREKNYRKMRGPGGAYGAAYWATFGLAQTPTYRQWDDHDGCGVNDSGQACAYWDRAFQVRGEYHPLPPGSGWPLNTYHSVGWGKHLRVFIVDTRSNRNKTFTAARSMLGPAQEAQLIADMLAAPETWKVLATTVPFHPYCAKNHDTWQGFPLSRAALLTAFAAVKNIVVVGADIHSGGAIDNGSTTTWPELSVPMANAGFGANTGCTDITWSEGRFWPSDPGFGLVTIPADGVTLTLAVHGADGAVRLQLTVPVAP